MKSYIFPIAFMASVAAAQSSSACLADYIVTSCLGSERPKFDACDINDWDCKCNAYTNILTCYNNCPNDPRKASEEGQRQIFCGYASQYPSKTTKLPENTGTATTGSTATGNSVVTTATGTDSGRGTAATTAASTSKPNAAGNLATNAGGMLAAVAGVVAAVL